jgi:hypothetical protein
MRYRPTMTSAFGLGCVKTFWAVAEPGETRLNNAEQAQFDVLFVASLEINRCIVVNVPDAVRRCQPLCLDRCQERLYTDDIHDAREIIGEYVQGHLGRNLRQALHQKMRRAHPHLERAEGVLSRLAA